MVKVFNKKFIRISENLKHIKTLRLSNEINQYTTLSLIGLFTLFSFKQNNICELHIEFKSILSRLQYTANLKCKYKAKFSRQTVNYHD